MQDLCASFVEVSPWQLLSVVDNLLVTGQNPASATASARDMITLLETQPTAVAASSYVHQQ